MDMAMTVVGGGSGVQEASNDIRVGSVTEPQIELLLNTHNMHMRTL